jgi:hypothetical protein
MYRERVGGGRQTGVVQTFTAHGSAETDVRCRRRTAEERFSIMVPAFMTSNSDLP